MRSFLDELRRRNVLRTLAAYLFLAWLIIQVADIVAPALGLPDWIMPFLLLSLAIGLPIAVLLSWFFQLSKGKLRREIENEAAPLPTRSRGIDLIIIAMLSAALATTLYLYQRGDNATFMTAVAPTVAILPLNDFGGAANSDGFVAGLHDRMLTTLASISALQVISRTSVQRYSGVKRSLPQIGRELGASAIVEGSVQRSGDRVQVNIQLIDAATDTHLWADTFERRVSTASLFAIQRDIAIAIAGHLNASLTGAERERIDKVPTQDLAAYSEYLLGRQKLAQRTSDSIAAAVEHFRRAVDADANYAEAHAGLAMAYDLLHAYGNLSRSDMLAKAMPAAQRSLLLDRDLVDGHTVLADLRAQAGDLAGAETAFQRALELNPNDATANHWYALLLLDKGQYEMALELHRRAFALDPRSVTLSNNVAQDLYYLGDATGAMRQYQRSLELDPRFVPTYAHMAFLLRTATGRPDQAVRWLRDAHELDPLHTEYPSQMAGTLLDLGDVDGAETWARRAFELGPERWWPNRAMLMVSLSRGDRAAAARHAETMLKLSAASAMALSALRDADMGAGNHGAARARYQAAMPALFETPPVVDSSSVQHAVGVAAVLLETGEEARAGALLEAALRSMEGMPASGLGGIDGARVEAYALLGNADAALSALREAIDANWVFGWWMCDRNPALASLHDLPEYRQLIDGLRDRMAQLRAGIEVSLPQ